MSIFGNLAGNKAMNAHRKGQYDQALELYREAYRKGMDNPAMLKNMATLLVRNAYFDEALEILKKLDRLSGMPDKERADIHIQYAVILWKKGHLDHAVEILEKDFETVRYGNIYSVLGYLLIEQGDAEKALAFNQAALEYDEEDPIFLENLAQTYYRLLHDKSQARVYFDRALERKPGLIDTNYFLALYDLEEGNRDSARKHLHTALEGRSSVLNFADREKINALLETL